MSATPPQQYDPVTVAQLFFQRTNLKGAEVEAYVQTYNWLEELKTGELTALPTAVLTGLRLKSEEQAKEVETLRAQLAVYEPEEAEDIPILDPPDELEEVD